MRESRSLTFVGLVLGTFMLSTAVTVHAEPPTGVRTVVASDSELITISARIRYATFVRLPEDERIVDVSCGDSGFWTVTSHLNTAQIKPAKEDSRTNVTLITASGRTYSFIVREDNLSAVKNAAVPDLLVHVNPNPAWAARIEKPKYVSYDDHERLQERLKGAEAELEKTGKLAVAAVRQAEAEAPLAIRFPYELETRQRNVAIPNVRPFHLVSAYHDGRFTYFQIDMTKAREMPPLYEIVGGEESVVQADMQAPGVLRVSKVMSRGYFKLGKDRLGFRTRASE
jgi:type IV secretory pathway VirB9-like protein